MVMATPTPTQPSAHRGLPPGISRDPWMLRLLGFDGVTVDPDSLGAAALRQTEHYRDAYREGEAWSRAEIAAGPAVHRDTKPDPGGLDIFALNATANGWLIGEKLEAIGHHSPQVPANQMDVLRRQGREPLDLEDLWRYIDEREVGGRQVVAAKSTSVFLNEGAPIPSISGRPSGGDGGRTASSEVDPQYEAARRAHLEEFKHYGMMARINGNCYSAEELRAMALGAAVAERQGMAGDGVKAMSTQIREEPCRETYEYIEREFDTEEFER
jgi:hypothetical protein